MLKWKVRNKKQTHHKQQFNAQNSVIWQKTINIETNIEIPFLIFNKSIDAQLCSLKNKDMQYNNSDAWFSMYKTIAGFVVHLLHVMTTI